MQKTKEALCRADQTWLSQLVDFLRVLAEGNATTEIKAHLAELGLPSLRQLMPPSKRPYVCLTLAKVGDKLMIVTAGGVTEEPLGPGELVIYEVNGSAKFHLAVIEHDKHGMFYAARRTLKPEDTIQRGEEYHSLAELLVIAWREEFALPGREHHFHESGESTVLWEQIQATNREWEAAK